MKEFFKKEDGAVIVLVALSMTIFMGFMALVVDIGSIYLEKSKLQKVADASALAGAQELPTNLEQSKTEVDNIITANHEEPNNFKVETNNNNTMIEVIGRKKATFYFARALGIEEPIIEARAKVDLQPLVSGKGAIPLGIQPSTDLLFGSTQTLKVSESANGNFGAIALTGPGAKNYEEDLLNGYESSIKIDDELKTESGSITGKTYNAVSTRINSCPDATFDNYPPGCERVVLIPIYVPIEFQGDKIVKVKVVGFGTFFLEKVASPSGGAEVTGRFIKTTISGASSQSQTDFGTYSFRLTN